MKKASDYLREAAQVIEERGKLRDMPDGERSMKRAVEAYTVLRGPVMESELDGWLFLCVLKLARATAGKPHTDDYTDLSGYAALAAECLERNAIVNPCLDLPPEASRMYGLREQSNWDTDASWERFDRGV